MTMKGRQSELFGDKRRVEHGGACSIGKRKKARPLSTRHPIHLTLRSSQALGDRSLLRYRSKIQNLANGVATRWGVRVYSMAVNGNHLHLIVKPGHRTGFQNFLRVFSGPVAMSVTRAAKGRPNRNGRFWDALAWTRIVEWGKAFWNLKKYVRQNELEAEGVIPYQPRKKRRVMRG